VTAEIANGCNDEISEILRNHPDQVIELGTLQIPDIDLTIAEMVEDEKPETGMIYDRWHL